MLPRLRYSLRSFFVFFVLAGIALALSVRALQWANRGIPDIERVIVQGTAAVDAVEGVANMEAPDTQNLANRKRVANCDVRSMRSADPRTR